MQRDKKRRKKNRREEGNVEVEWRSRCSGMEKIGEWGEAVSRMIFLTFF